jgi:hypothetical protein
MDKFILSIEILFVFSIIYYFMTARVKLKFAAKKLFQTKLFKYNYLLSLTSLLILLVTMQKWQENSNIEVRLVYLFIFVIVFLTYYQNRRSND